VSARVGFLGLSHLGILSSAAWASKGVQVVAVDPDAELVKRLVRGEPPIYEPGLGELLLGSRGTLRHSARLEDLRRCPLVLVSRDTPTDEQGVSDPDVVTRLILSAVPFLSPDVVLVVMSQVPPGYTRALAAKIAGQRPELSLRLHYLVETLVFGSAVDRATRPERFIVGVAEPDGPLADPLREALDLFGCPILAMSYESAELAKMAINLYLIGSVTYANTMADLSEAVGADWNQIVPALRLDARIGPAAYLRPGLGISGGNLERDLMALQRIGASAGIDETYLHALDAHNARRSEWLLRETERALSGAGGRPTIALWGLAYKKGTRSLKNASSLRVIQALRGRSSVRAWDPVVTGDDLIGALGPAHEVTLAPSPEDAASGADCLLVLTEWDELKEADLAAVRTSMRRPVVVDCVGLVDPRRARGAGLELHRMGERGGVRGGQTT
jgi:UDPglucose 6-dehydrogenase